MNKETQLELWVTGNPLHNKTTGECTPDLSCCKTGMAELRDRVHYYEAFKARNFTKMNELSLKFLFNAMRSGTRKRKKPHGCYNTIN
jgi:hypothetical protein